ncbi:halocyanin domain-containing protein [Haloferax marisrubri]|uniref:Halocyanin domain-containing protein n=1 Tax=Haloferax marisrubri TaxID=1544719 RepID=A0A2P4NKW0_9EURY|nr:halocyanin domain-containing protein [Haloferax marisrubri]POG53766.1 halocyanin domain-containing protein [Haloferax marisrubri]
MTQRTHDTRRDTRDSTRRTYLKASGALLAGGFLAGCTGGTDGGGSTAETTDAGSDSTADSTATAGATTTDAEQSTGDLPSLSDEAVEYLSNAQSYDGDGVADYTGQSELSVENGAGTRGMAFDPAAIAVDAGTTVTWEWTGRGGEHDVVAVDGTFESELVDSATKTFSYTFETAGEFLYNCSEHEDKGMKGVVVVV